MVIGRITKGGQPVKKAKWLGTDFAPILNLNTEAKIVMDPTKSLKIAHPGTPVSTVIWNNIQSDPELCWVWRAV